MTGYKIKIIAEYEGTYYAEDLEDAKEIAQNEADSAYNRLNGRYGVEVEYVMTLKEKRWRQLN